MIVEKDFDALFKKICLELIDSPEYSPRDQKTKEIINANLCILEPQKCILTNPHRKLSKKYIGAEILWYLSGTDNISEIKKYAKLWEKIADNGGKVNSAYGWQIFTQKTPEKKSQWEYIANTLINDTYSRQAVININQPCHKYNTKDVPCTLTIQYLIRDNKLHCIVNMRSSDAIWGLGNDIPFFAFLQIKLLSYLRKCKYRNLELGHYYHNSASLHVYERHYDMLKNIVYDSENYESESWSLENSRNVFKCKRWKTQKDFNQ